MPDILQAILQNQREIAVNLLNQQVWCWGRDIVRSEGNWLLETGFERIEPPANRSGCPSIYKTELAGGRGVVLRGFGVIFSAPLLGTVFLPRYEFSPLYTPQAELDRLPWNRDDLPSMRVPSQSQQQVCATLVSDCLNWIGLYEADVFDKLGIDYRRSSLDAWNDGIKTVFPPDEVAAAWHTLAQIVASDSNTLLPPKHSGAFRSANTGKRSARGKLNVKSRRSAADGGKGSRSHSRPWPSV